MSIRLKLTLLYSALLALTLVIFSSVLYFSVERSTLRIAHDLLGSIQWVMDGKQPPLSVFDRRPALIRLNAPETYTQLRALDGQVIEHDATVGNTVILPLNENGLAAVKQGEVWTEEASVGTEQLLVRSWLVTEPGKEARIKQIAQSLANRDRFLTVLQSVLVIGSSITVVIAFGIGWLLAGLTLYPMSRIRQTAQTIGAERDFGRRIDYEGPNDEIGQLATTFNDMLTRLQAAYVQVEQSLQTQRRFVADASHELRTPLTTLRGNLHLLQRQPPLMSEEQADILADVVAENERLIRLVNDLLSLARVDAKRSLQSEAILIQPMLEDLRQQIQLLTPDQKIICNLEPEISILGDHDALKQVLLALLDNAVKHTPSPSTITLATTITGHQAVITIQDNGPGIEPAALPHIFDRFYRGNTARTGTGAGLGLAIAKELTEAQHGTLTVESQVGYGTTFTLTFPKV